MLCHLPLLLPLAGLALFLVLPWPVALGLWLALTLLALAVGVPTFRALYGPPMTGAAGMRGREAVVVAAEGRSGLVRCDGELWTYTAPEPLSVGDRVRIVEVEGLTVAVRRAAGERAVAAR